MHGGRSGRSGMLELSLDTKGRILLLDFRLLDFRLLFFQLLGFQLRVYLLILRHHTILRRFVVLADKTQQRGENACKKNCQLVFCSP